MRGAPLLTGSIKTFCRRNDDVNQTFVCQLGLFFDSLFKGIIFRDFIYMGINLLNKKEFPAASLHRPVPCTFRHWLTIILNSNFLRQIYFLKYFVFISNCLYVSLCSRGTLSQHSGSAVESTSDKVL
jgi:hypothetical protein